MKIQRRDRGELHFEGGIRDRTAACAIVSESQDLKIYERTVTFA